uniref:Uncharacterized protein n=1 Tax=Oryza meridionalis TaxID=40149 RepID=A0A0E0DZ36_9ORYZ
MVYTSRGRGRHGWRPAASLNLARTPSVASWTTDRQKRLAIVAYWTTDRQGRARRLLCHGKPGRAAVVAQRRNGPRPWDQHLGAGSLFRLFSSPVTGISNLEFRIQSFRLADEPIDAMNV